MDALKGLEAMDEDSVDLIVTDPPYYIEKLKDNLKGQTLRRSSKNNIFHAEWDSLWANKQDFLDWITVLLLEFKRVLRPKGQIYMFMSYHHTPEITMIIKNLGFKFYKPLIWYKPDTMGVFPNQYGCNYEQILWFREDSKKGDDYNVRLNIGNGQRDVFTFTSTNPSYRETCGFHPTCKPIALVRKLVKNGSDEGDVVLDPFMGSGTTAVACKQLNRAYIGFELEKEYIKTINKRLEQGILKKWIVE